jgi:hypothetical protein
MDLNVVERENTVLGQDFLTWLWYRIESGSHMFNTKDGKVFSVNMEQRVSVQGGEGEGIETATVNSPRGELTEAKTGLKTGKKVCRAQLRFQADEEEWTVTIKAEDFCMSALKTPKVATKDEEGDDPDAKFLEKMYLIERATSMFDSMFDDFLKIRLDSAWQDEARKVGEWIGAL